MEEVGFFQIRTAAFMNCIASTESGVGRKGQQSYSL